MILVVGDSQLYGNLKRKLPSARCTLKLADTVPQALQLALEASLIIVNAQMQGGEGEDLCRLLRTDRFTADTPIFVRGTSHQRVPSANEVLSNDLQQTIDVIETYFPELAAATPAAPPVELAEEDIFDIRESADAWRRRASESTWPPPPPVYETGNDLERFATDYAGYVQSLVEGFSQPSSSPSRQERLIAMSAQTVATMDEVLKTTQAGINDALKRGDLTLMRTLSVGKNVLFEKLQRLRALQGSTKTPPAAAAAGGSRPSTSEALRALSPTSPGAEGKAVGRGGEVDEQALEALGTTGPNALSATGKSRLTLAAEAREQERSRAMASAAALRSAQARRNTARSTNLLTVAVIVAIGAAVAGWIAFGPKTNQSPVMNFVTVQQAPAGIQATVSAIDAENDLISYTFRWLVDNNPVDNATTNVLPASLYRPGAKVVVQVTPADAYGVGQTMRSQPLVVVALAGTPR